MVLHETYLDANGQLLFPEQVARRDDGRLVHATTGAPVTAGAVEKMSKSKRNVVDPEDIIAAFGADTARLFMLSDSPPERDLEWTAAGADGVGRFLNRLWRLVDEAPPASAGTGGANDGVLAIRRATHRTIAAFTADLEGFHFNRAVARLYELVNTLTGMESEGPAAITAYREGLETLVRLIAPICPHLAEELWQRLGHDRLLVETPWPEADPALVAETDVTIAVQVNGRLRATLTVPKGLANAAAEKAALDDPAVARAIGDKPVRRVIVVPDRIVNVVV